MRVYLALCWCSSLISSDSLEWQRFWAGHLPTSGTKWSPRAPPPAWQIHAERPEPSGHRLDLKGKENSLGMEAHSKTTLWRRPQVQKLLHNCSLEGSNGDRERHWAVQGICLNSIVTGDLETTILCRLTRNKQEPNPAEVDWWDCGRIV